MYYDTLDIIEAYYCFFTDYHDGIESRNYHRLCKLKSYFNPSPYLDYDILSGNAKKIYNVLARKHEFNYLGV